jgi:AcrR family transcriptional regulator
MSYPERAFNNVTSAGGPVKRPYPAGEEVRMPENVPGRRAGKFVRKTKVERQREIVDAAVQLIGRYGVQGTTVSRIAQTAGIARGALYQHFPNREAVLEAALDAWRERSSAWMAQSAADDVPTRLLRMGEAHSSWALSEYNTFVRPFFQLVASHRQTALTRSIIERQQEDFRYLVRLAEEGKQQGTIATDADPGDVAWSLLLHAWGEDVARLMGVDRFITEGVSTRILGRLLDSYGSGACAPAAKSEAGGAGG